MLAAAWMGASLFLASLAYFAYFYLVVLGRPVAPPPEGLATAVGINVGLFTLFALHHSVLARGWAKHRVARVVPHALERVAYVWLASVLFLAACLLWRPLPGIAWEASGLAAWPLRAAQAAGVALTLASASRIDIWELAGIRQASAYARLTRPAPALPQSAAPSVSVSSASPYRGTSSLEAAGPYRWLRHPIYLGWVLLVFGVPVMTNGRLLFAAVSTGYLIAALPFEERSLISEFGGAYRDYQRRVRWRLVPGVW